MSISFLQFLPFPVTCERHGVNDMPSPLIVLVLFVGLKSLVGHRAVRGPRQIPQRQSDLMTIASRDRRLNVPSEVRPRSRS